MLPVRTAASFSAFLLVIVFAISSGSAHQLRTGDSLDLFSGLTRLNSATSGSTTSTSYPSTYSTSGAVVSSTANAANDPTTSTSYPSASPTSGAVVSSTTNAANGGVSGAVNLGGFSGDSATNVDNDNAPTSITPCWNVNPDLCNCPDIDREAIFTIDDDAKEYELEDIIFTEAKWIKKHVKKHITRNKFGVEINCNCCKKYDEVVDPLCHYKCRSRMTVQAQTAAWPLGPTLYMSNYANGRSVQFGDILFSSESAHYVWVDAGHGDDPDRRRRRRLLQKVAPC